MYEAHFGLSEVPFSITPDTSFFFGSPHSQEALNTLLVAARSGEGFIKITGEVGTGKTLLCRKFMATLGEEFVTAYVPNPYLEPRALMLAPRILLIDEPSVGLAPVLVSRTIDKIKELKDQYRLTVLMAEQNFPQALRIADRGYVIVHGQIAFEGRSADELNNNELIRKFYLGL